MSLLSRHTQSRHVHTLATYLDELSLRHLVLANYHEIKKPATRTCGEREDMQNGEKRRCETEWCEISRCQQW